MTGFGTGRVVGLAVTRETGVVVPDGVGPADTIVATVGESPTGGALSPSDDDAATDDAVANAAPVDGRSDQATASTTSARATTTTTSLLDGDKVLPQRGSITLGCVLRLHRDPRTEDSRAGRGQLARRET